MDIFFKLVVLFKIHINLYAFSKHFCRSRKDFSYFVLSDVHIFDLDILSN